MRNLGFAAMWYLTRILVTLVYFLPTIAAAHNQHPKRQSILFINILLGWTVIGWIIALRWAFKLSGARK